jgi:hypothetical protein
MSKGLDISQMLQELLDAEKEIERSKLTQKSDVQLEIPVRPLRNPQRKRSGSALEVTKMQISQSEDQNNVMVKSVSFDDVRIVNEYVNEEPVADASEISNPMLRRTDSQRSILKEPSQHIEPDILYLDPQIFISMQVSDVEDASEAGSSSDSDNDSIEFGSDGGEGVSEDIEIHRDDDQSDSDYDEYDTMLNMLDEYADDSRNIENDVAQAKVPVKAEPVTFYGQSIQPNRQSLPTPATIVDLQPTPNLVQKSKHKRSLSDQNLPTKEQQSVRPLVDDEDDIPLGALGAHRIVSPLLMKSTTSPVPNSDPDFNIRIFIQSTNKLMNYSVPKHITALGVLQDLEKHIAGPYVALFEHCSQLGIERPIREFESMHAVCAAWDDPRLFSIVVRDYKQKSTLQRSVKFDLTKFLRGRYPRIKGSLSLETKPGTWKKRFFILEESNLYFVENSTVYPF